MKKSYLVIRLSSIGDILLTTPVIRCLKKQLDADIHFLTKDRNVSLLRNNPYIDKIWSYENDFLKKDSAFWNEEFSIVIDLHKNARTYQIKSALKTPTISYHKANIKKWLMVNWDNRIWVSHINDRYFEALEELGVQYDEMGIDYFIPREFEKDFLESKPKISKNKYTVLAIGAAHDTKRYPADKCVDLIDLSPYTTVLIGGKDMISRADYIESKSKKTILNLVGKTSLDESAVLIKNALVTISGDSAMMHLTAALKKQLVVLWGSTAPNVGMYPLYPTGLASWRGIQVEGLSCQPCTKIGRSHCPKGHFRCMNGISSNDIISTINELI